MGGVGDHAVGRGQRLPPAAQPPGIRGDLDEPDRDHYGVQQQVADDQRDRDPDGLVEPGQEHRAEHRQQHQRDPHTLVP